MTRKSAHYIGSLDHAPSEQLNGRPDQWHTTVLILSEGGEHFKLARELAKKLKSQGGVLRKWDGYRRYKDKFEQALADTHPNFPVHIRAISVQAKTIKLSTPHMINELKLNGLVNQSIIEGKSYIEFGPFQKVIREEINNDRIDKSYEPVTFKLLEHQAQPLIFICHSLLRFHKDMMLLIKNVQPALEWIDWQIGHDKFPGGITGPMASLFHAIMSGSTNARLLAGNIRVLTFNDKNSYAYI